MAYTLGVVLFLKQKRGQNLDVSFEFQIPTSVNVTFYFKKPIIVITVPTTPITPKHKKQSLFS